MSVREKLCLHMRCLAHLDPPRAPTRRIVTVLRILGNQRLHLYLQITVRDGGERLLWQLARDIWLYLITVSLCALCRRRPHGKHC